MKIIHLFFNLLNIYNKNTLNDRWELILSLDSFTLDKTIIKFALKEYFNNCLFHFLSPENSFVEILDHL